MTIQETYRRLHPRSAELHEEAVRTFPSGVTHDIRHLDPFPLYVDHASGSRKWDVDGNEIVDYVMGHGALFLGHAYPEITKAVQEQAAKGTHYGAGHELELKWGAAVKRLVPSAEMVRFTSSGTEATLMAVRLARAYTGRDKLLKFDYHFHGWHDSVVGARYGESDVPRSAGVPEATLSNTISIPQNDIDEVERRLAEGDVAAVILEPTGASWGTLPLRDGFLADLRQATARHNTVLIFDEVVTGFRVSPGGAQALYGVTPDLTAMAKILAGGLPGGGVAGRADIISLIEFRDDADWNNRQRVFHPGTFNANPLSAAAGVTMLSLVETGRFHAHAAAVTERLARGMNEAISGLGVNGCAYGLASCLHLSLGVECPRPQDGIEWPNLNGKSPPRTAPELALALRLGMLNHGIDLMGMTGALVSGVHTDADVDLTLAAFEATLGEMRAERLL
ncbi:MAG: aspartate aminotransferase family protein [Dehalococcoidia bacterium]|nr:aspartate aminotransferase family protein [Dehalococcoidia bacterium]